jgi:hypothetical protein
VQKQELFSLLFPKKEPQERLRWHWQRDSTHSFVAKGKRTRCFVEAVLVLSRQHHAPATSELASQEDMRDYFSLVFLLDTRLVGPHDRAVMQARLHRLLLWRESVERQPHYRQFPPVLVLTHSARGRETWYITFRCIQSSTIYSLAAKICKIPNCLIIYSYICIFLLV